MKSIKILVNRSVISALGSITRISGVVSSVALIYDSDIDYTFINYSNLRGCNMKITSEIIDGNILK